MLEFVEKDGKLRCIFSVALDSAACDEIAETINARTEKTELPVVFDLKHVDYVASSFFRICIVVRNKLGADRFSVADPQPMVRRTFRLAGLDRIIRIEPG